jgi:protein TonB
MYRALFLLIAFVIVGCQNTPRNQSIEYQAPEKKFDGQEELLSFDPPKYPFYDLQQRVTGRVVVAYSINVKGTVENARILEEDPKGIFSNAALRSVNSHVYSPRMVDGQPVRVDNKTTLIIFKIKE